MERNSLRDVAKALRSCFLGADTSFEGLSPPQELVQLIDSCLATQHATPAVEADFIRLHDALVDITGDISRSKERGALVGRTNAWLIVLDQLRHLEGGVVPRDIVSQLLWPSLLRRVMLQSGDLQLSRQGVTSAKAILINACKVEHVDGAGLGALESEILADYLAITEGVDGSADLRMRGTKAQDRGVALSEDVLIAIIKAQPRILLKHFARILPAQPQQRVALLRLMGDFCRAHPAQAFHTLQSGLLDTLILLITVDDEIHVVQLALATVIVLLPRIMTNIEQLLPALLVVYGRALCMIDIGMVGTQVQAEAISLEASSAATVRHQPHLRDGVVWQQAVRESVGPPEINHLPLDIVQQLFTILYGLVPCNLLAFLRAPLSYLQEKQWQSPYADNVTLPFDEGDLRDRCVLNLRAHTINPALVTSSSSAELAELPRLAQVETAEIAMRCHALLAGEKATPGKFEIDMKNIPSSRSAASAASYIDAYVGVRTDTKSDTKSLSASNSAASNVESPTKQQLPSQQAARIAYLEREVSMLRAELSYELYLRQQHSDKLGVMHRDRIKEASGDAERQALNDALRVYKSRLATAEALVKQSRNEAAMSKAQSRHWAKRQQVRIAALKDTEKTARDREKMDQARLEEAQAALVAQAKDLEIANNRLYDLENQARLDTIKLDERADLEARNQRLTSFLLAWDEDMSKARAQRTRIEAIISEHQKAMDLKESDARIIEALRAELTAAEQRAKQMNEKKPASPISPKLEQSESQYERGQTILREQYRALRSKTQRLEEELAELKLARGRPVASEAQV